MRVKIITIVKAKVEYIESIKNSKKDMIMALMLF